MVTKELKNTELTKKPNSSSSLKTCNSFPPKGGFFQMKRFKQGTKLRECQMKHIGVSWGSLMLP